MSGGFGSDLGDVGAGLSQSSRRVGSLRCFPLELVLRKGVRLLDRWVYLQVGENGLSKGLSLNYLKWSEKQRHTPGNDLRL